MCGACLGLVYAGRVEHLVAAAGRPPALPRRPHRSLRRAWAWQGAVGGALSTVGGACTRGNAKKETHFSGWTACPAVNDVPDHAFCNPNAQHRPPLLSAMPCTAQVLPECKASASASRRRPSEARRDAAPPAAAPAAAAAAAADPGGVGPSGASDVGLGWGGGKGVGGLSGDRLPAAGGARSADMCARMPQK